MGKLIEGKWHDQWYEPKDGRFIRESAKFHNWLSADGAPGPDGQTGFKAEKDRYHLYVSLACPWAHRTLIFRKLKQLDEYIGVTVVKALMLENGWELADDPINGFEYMHQAYTTTDPKYTGRVTVPVLWDKQTNQIVCNESGEIIRMLNTAFNELTGDKQDFYPEALRADIDAINDIIYNNINNGVYRAGFATTQEAYEEAFDQLFAALDDCEQRLSQQRYLVGNTLTEADWRFFTTLLRFDAVYYGHFKTNLRRIIDYPNLWNYLRDLYQHPGVAETVDIPHIKLHYYGSHAKVNPTGIVPKGPEIDFMQPHDRDKF